MSRLHFLRQAPPPELASGLLEFERQFTYPLGANDSFSISHAPDYVTFFRALGEATVLAVEEEGRILGTLAAVVRTLRTPDGEERTVAYLADLKLVREVRHRLTRYLLAMSEHLNVPGGCGYAVVMDGTRSTPDRYTGRWGVPAFQPLAKVTVLTLQTRSGIERDCTAVPAGLFHPAGSVMPLPGRAEIRSQCAPEWLAWGSASGLLEDTRRGKKLLHASGHEMRAAHLSRFRYDQDRDAVVLLEQAAYRCARQGIPTLFACLPQRAAQRLLPHLRGLTLNPAQATVYGVGFPSDWDEWWLDSAEI